MKWGKLLLSFCLAATMTKAFSQDAATYAADTAQVNKLLAESKKFFASDQDKAIGLSMQAKAIAEKAGFKEGEAYALKHIGVANYYKSNYEDAVQFYNQSLAIFQSLKDYKGISNMLSNIGVVYYDKGDDTKALDYYLQSLRYAEQSNDKLRILTALNNIGGIYFIKVQNYDTATKSNQVSYQSYLSKTLQYYLMALPLCQELGDNQSLGKISVNVGLTYFHKNENDTALIYFNKALNAFGDSEGSLDAYNGIAKVYLKEKKFELALNNYNKALFIAKKSGIKMSLVQTYMGLGNVHKEMNDYSTAIKYYEQAEKPAVEIEATHELHDLYKEMAIAYSKVSDFKSAFTYQALFTSISTQIYNENQDKRLAAMQFGYDLEKKQTEINLLTKDKSIQELQIKRQKAFRNALIFGLITFLIIGFVLYRDYRLKIKTNKLLDKQKMQIESLLLNILPQEVAYELQSTGKATPRNYEKVSVLFTDFKSFTSHAEKMSPDEVVRELNTCFMAFDEIIEKHNLEKIKTIGDAYMCAGGIPTTDEDHVFRIVKASLEIQEFIYTNNKRRTEENLPPWEIRIGINVGPVVAGVVGKKKYAYDIWGSAVNIASRMESNGMPGQINISSAVYEFIKDKYACIYRGKIYAKNVGEIDMYFIDHEIESFDGFRAFEEAEKKESASPQQKSDVLQLDSD